MKKDLYMLLTIEVNVFNLLLVLCAVQRRLCVTLWVTLKQPTCQGPCRGCLIPSTWCSHPAPVTLPPQRKWTTLLRPSAGDATLVSATKKWSAVPFPTSLFKSYCDCSSRQKLIVASPYISKEHPSQNCLLTTAVSNTDKGEEGRAVAYRLHQIYLSTFLPTVTHGWRLMDLSAFRMIPSTIPSSWLAQYNPDVASLPHIHWFVIFLHPHSLVCYLLTPTSTGLLSSYPHIHWIVIFHPQHLLEC